MPWPGIPFKIATLLLIATVGPPGINSEGNVGCLFSNRLCLEDEWCFDDYAFGRCTPAGDVDEEDIFRFDLKREELHELKRELQRLFALGYRWSHGYTQCRLQAMLYAMKHDIPFEEDACSHLVDQDLEGALKAMDVQDPMDPREVAIIKYTPSIVEGDGKYADEVYYPPSVGAIEREALRNKILSPNGIDILDMPDPYAEYQMVKRAWIPQMHRRSPPIITIKSTRDFADDDLLEFLTSPPIEERRPIQPAIPDNIEEEPELPLDIRMEMYPLIEFLDKNQLTPTELKMMLSQESYRALTRLLVQFDNTVRKQDYLMQEILAAQQGDLDEQLPDHFRIPTERMRENEEEEDGDFEISPGPTEILMELKNAQWPAERDESEQGTGQEIFRELEKSRQNQNRHSNHHHEAHPGVYTEGGVVYPESHTFNGNGKSAEETLSDDVEKLLEKYTNFGFKRPERLDVKKPGPLFNFPANEDLKRKGYINAMKMYMPYVMKKGPRGAPHPNPHKLDFYDMEENNDDYVFVGFSRDFKTWGQGQDIINNISYALHLEPSNFENGHVIGNVVTFKVLPNSKGMNASEVANRIVALKDQITQGTGLKIIQAGIKDQPIEKKSSMRAHIIPFLKHTSKPTPNSSIKMRNNAKMQAVLSAPMINDNEFYIVIFMVCGVLGAMIVAAALLIIIRRHIKSKEKLQGLSKPDTEASKDYQDLCRARMSVKGQPVGDVHGRITSLSKESEQSPSSRSSTSSWSEEPALHNMDISTGHIVLNYMEDHLKNKDRLEQEWVALCAYVAEPCAITVALKKENIDKNRYPEIVPYDHSRVVLNELSNANGSDYINASSITDHDPRNPAYIATQGPLPHTSADFWQLIWEQGAVVIVMLTRLTESGTAMCHRYWPEEGSELYHIYEVHLVSEHIWCDDYLVRSFYLKNARTGETRTVTQFHFLSWAETGVPASTKALLEFRRKVNKSYRGRSCPIVVHCSDGAGRTGTYCLIDMVLSRMAKGAKEIDIAATLEHLRDQRVKMVASKQQFEFVLTAVAEEVHAILKVLPSQPTASQQEKEK